MVKIMHISLIKNGVLSFTIYVMFDILCLCLRNISILFGNLFYCGIGEKDSVFHII